jgi:hypothetical protein
MKLNIPYKDCKPLDITQKFWNLQADNKHHLGVDFCPSNAYGKILVAPEDVIIITVIDETIFGGDFMQDLQRGFGLTMKSIADPNVVHLFWHCMSIFPVKAGDTVKRGTFVGQIGNSGYCLTGGVYVPLASRQSGKGSHLHWERRDARYDPDYTDVVPEIDFTSKVTLSWDNNVKQLLQNMVNLIGNKK